MPTQKTPEILADDDLDAASGGHSVPLENATVAEIRTEQLNTARKSASSALPLGSASLAHPKR